MAGQQIENCIRELRRRHGDMTQQQLGDTIGVTRQTVIAIENSKYSPSLATAFAIAAVFGVRVDEVFRAPQRPRRG